MYAVRLVIGLALLATFGYLASTRSCPAWTSAKHLLGLGTSTAAAGEVSTAANASAKKLDTPFKPFDEAFASARKEQKLVMVDVYTDWCGWCKKLDQDVYTDPKVVGELANHFEATKLNAESKVTHKFDDNTLTEAQIAGHWGIDSYPTIMFLSSTDSVVKVLTGYIPAAEFDAILRYMSSGAYQTEEFEDWKKTHV